LALLFSVSGCRTAARANAIANAPCLIWQHTLAKNAARDIASESLDRRDVLGLQADAPVKNTAKHGTIAEIPGNRRSLYEVQYMLRYFLAFLFLSSFCMPCKIIVDNGLWDVYIMGLL
jgi:hypothetical protein